MNKQRIEQRMVPKSDDFMLCITEDTHTNPAPNSNSQAKASRCSA